MRRRWWQARRFRSARYAAIVLTTVAGLVVVGVPSAGAKIRRESWAWDPGVEAIAHRVERLRGLRFRYPVRVERRGGALAGPSRGSSGSAELARALRHLQALGVVPATATAADLASGSTRHPLGQYDPDTQSITVYRRRMDALTRVVIAHELTHALDDQHYHFARVDRSLASPSGGSARRAAVEGDARRIEDAYFAGLPAAERRRASRSYQQLHEQAAAHITDPLAVEWEAVLADAPYTLGLQLTRLTALDGGEHALRALLTSRPSDDLGVIDPAPTGRGRSWWRYVDVHLGPGERSDGRATSGALDIYLLLAGRTSPDVAFHAVDASVGAGTVWFKRNGVPCAHVALRPRPNRADDVLRGVDAFVAHAGPSAQRGLAGHDVVLTTCVGSPALERGATSIPELVLAARNRALIAARSVHATAADRRCISDAILRDARYRLDLHTHSARGLGGVDPSFAAAMRRASAICGTAPPR